MKTVQTIPIMQKEGNYIKGEMIQKCGNVHN